MEKSKLDIEELKEQITNVSLIVIGVASSLLFVFLIIRSFQKGFRAETGIQVAALFILCLLAFFRKELPFGLKTVIILLVTSVIFLFETIYWGILSSSDLYIILILIFMTGFLSFRQSLLITLVYLLAFLCIGYLFHKQVLSLPEVYTAPGFSTKILPWIFSFLNLCIVAFSVLIVLTQFTGIYNHTIASLRDSEAKYRSLSESASTGIWQVNEKGYTEYANPAMCRLLELNSEADLAGVHFTSFYSEESLEIMRQENYRRLSGKSVTYELVLTGKLGTQRNIMVSASPLFNENREISGTIVSIIDITPRKKAEQEVEKYREHLEKLVIERTEELGLSNEELITANRELIFQREELQTALDELHNAHQQLVESEKMVSLGILAAGISHEINNPLNFIQGGLSGLDEYFNDNLAGHKEQVKILLDGIQEGINRASKIVSSLSHFSRNTESQSERCDIHAIIDNCLVMLQNQLKHKIRVEKNYTKLPFTLNGNEGKLHQAFLNILLNACQSIQDTGTISITTETSKHDLSISIADTGCGIKSGDLPKIFDPFFTTKAPGMGTGLGLSITYTILQAHRGEVEIKSLVGEGTTAIIRLPKF